MKLIVPVLPGDPPCHLHLEPESDADRKTLEKLLERGVTCGFGREPTTNALLHVQVKIAASGVVPVKDEWTQHDGGQLGFNEPKGKSQT